MNNEKYISYYMESLTNSLNDCFAKNLSMQANARISDEVILEQSKLIEELQRYSQIGENEKAGNIASLNGIVEEKNRIINGLNSELERLKAVESHYENIKHQLNHLESTRNELVSAREQHHIEISTLKENHQNEISKLNADNDSKLLEISTLKENYQNEIFQLNTNHQSKLLEISKQIETIKTPSAKTKKKVVEVEPKAEEVKKVTLSLVKPIDDAIRDGGSF